MERKRRAFISVEPKYRRDGIATALMFECHKRLKEKGLRLHLTETICDGGKAFFADFIERHKDKMVLKKVPHFKDKKLHELI